MRKIPKWLVLLLGVLAVTHPDVAEQLGAVVSVIQHSVGTIIEYSIIP